MQESASAPHTIETIHSDMNTAPVTGKGSRSALIGEWDKFEENGRMYQLEAVAWIYKDAAKRAMRYPEVVVGDGVYCTNNRRRPLYNMATVGPAGENIVFFEALLPSQKMRIFAWLYFDALPFLMGRDFCSAVQLFVTDCDIWQVNLQLNEHF